MSAFDSATPRPVRTGLASAALCVAFLAGAPVAATPARAQDAPAPVAAEASADLDPATREAASRLLDTLRVRELMAQMMESLPGMLAGSLPLGPDQDPAMRDEIMRLAMLKMQEYIGFDAMRDDYVALYADTYTAGDMNALSDFFDTDVGKRYLDAQPAMTAASANIVQQRMQVAFPEMMTYMEGEVARLRAEAEAE